MTTSILFSLTFVFGTIQLLCHTKIFDKTIPYFTIIFVGYNVENKYLDIINRIVLVFSLIYQVYFWGIYFNFIEKLS